MTFYLSTANLNPLLRNLLVFAVCILHKLQYFGACKQVPRVGRDFFFVLEVTKFNKQSCHYARYESTWVIGGRAPVILTLALD